MPSRRTFLATGSGRPSGGDCARQRGAGDAKGGPRASDVDPAKGQRAGQLHVFGRRKGARRISINRSNGSFDLGYPLTRSLFVRGVSSWQRTHGGLRAGSPSLPFPGELNTPERYAQRDRLLRTMYWHFGGGIAYSLGRADVYGAVDKYVWGRDVHNGIAYTVGTTFYFDLAKPQP